MRPDTYGIYSDPLSFGPIHYASIQVSGVPRTALPAEERIPLGYTVEEDGTVRFQLHYPNAGKVTVHSPFSDTDLERRGEFWSGTARFRPGFTPVWLTVDGSLAISPYLPLCFSDNRPINFVNTPDGTDIRVVRDVPHGIVAEDFQRNSVTGLPECIRVYLPPTYFAEPERRFPVLYLQHGIGENETAWTTQGKINFVLDNLLAAGEIEPVIVVMCNGMLVTADETESRLGCGFFHEFLTHDVIPHIQRRFRVEADREHRVMAGLSMGSIQTSRTALFHPELFRAIGLFSGFLSDPLGGYNDHLAPERLAAFRDSGTYLFRIIGDEDPFMPVFVNDDGILAAAGIDCDRRIYHGNHEWNVWRRCFVDFVRLVFGTDRPEAGR
jgi:enterochelin esterase-like enzyme